MKIPTHEPNIYLEVPGSLNDFQIVREIYCEDVYRVRSHLKDETAVVVDIGAYFGAFSRLAKEYAPNAQIHAIEAHPANFQYLEKNLKDIDAELSQIALSNYTGSAKITDEGGSSRLGNDGIVVPVDDASHFFSTFDEIDILKIDVEGSETAIIEALTHEQLKSIKYLTIEFEKGDAYERITKRLSETHAVQTLGSHATGGYIYAERY